MKLFNLMRKGIIGVIALTPILSCLYSNDVFNVSASGTGSFESGQNTDYSLGGTLNSNAQGMGILYDTTYNTDYESSNVIGAKITVYHCNDATTVQSLKMNMSSSNVESALKSNKFSLVQQGSNGTYSYCVYKPEAYDYVTVNTPYIANPNSGTYNGWYPSSWGNQWVKKYGDQSLNVNGRYLTGLQGINGLSFIDGYDLWFNTSIWRINSGETWFVGSGNSIPDDTKRLAERSTESLINSGKVGESDCVMFFVEPLIAVDLEVPDSTGYWVSNIAATPTMLASLVDKGWNNTGLGYRIGDIINNTGTDMVAGSDTNLCSTDNLNTINRDGTGAYAVILTPGEAVSHDELPEIPSVPVFIKDSKTGSTIHYSDISSTIPQNVWKDITDVLSYAMHLTEVEPSNGLCNNWVIQDYINEMREYSNNAKDSEGYNPLYSQKYEALWNAICGYYNNTEISLEGTSTNIPVRMSNTQPSGVNTKFGSGNGPFVVDGGSLGGISSVNYTMNYAENGAQFYALGDQLDIVSTGTTDIGGLGSSTGGKTLSVGDILRNPYRYSIVVEDTESISTLTGDPEPPNIIVYDEKGDRAWEASIDKNSWNSVLNTIHYMQGKDASNVLGISEADTARNARNWTSYDGEECSFTSDYNVWLTEKKKLEEKKQALVELNTELDNTVSTINDVLGSTTNLINSGHIKDIETYVGDITSYQSSWAYCKNKDSDYKPFKALVDGKIANGLFRPGAKNCGYMDKLGDVYGYWTIYCDYMRNRYCDTYADRKFVLNYNTGYPNVSAGSDYFRTSNYNGEGQWHYMMPGWSDVYGSTDTNGAQSMAQEIMAEWYLENAKDAYASIKTTNNTHISELDTLITKYQTLIDDYNSHLTTYDTNYNTALSKIGECFSGQMLVNGTKYGDGAIENDITDNLCKRGGDSAIGGMSHLYKYQTYKANESGQMYAAWIASNNYYSAYNNYDGVVARNLGPISSSLYSEISKVYNSQEYPLNFRYRVVHTDSPSAVMTSASIKDYVNKPCGYTLSYKDVIESPYSYGIIINCYETIKKDPTIEEWQTSIKTTQEDLDDSSFWNWGGSDRNFTIKFETPEDTLELSKPIPGEGTVTWFTGKITGKSNGGTQGTPPIVADGSPLGLSEGNPSWSSSGGKKRALYQITKNWGGGSGTVTILTTDITSKVLNPCSNTYVNVSGESSFSYDVNSGSVFNIWKNNGIFNLDARFPMMRASMAVNGTSSNAPKPNTLVNDGYGGTFATPISFATGDSGFYPVMCRIPGSSERSIETQYNVKFSYGGTAKISTTFSTDEDDTSDMQSVIDGMSGMVIPYVKAGQNIDGELNSNDLVIEGWCNVGSGVDVKSNGTNATFNTIDDFKNAMNNLVNDVKSNAKYEILSTVNGFSVDYNNNAVADAGSYQIEHSQASGKVDQQAGLKFETSGSEANSSTVTDEESGVYINRYARLSGQSYSEDDHGPIGNAGVLGSKTQEAYNRLMVVGEGDGDWYYEYSEGLTEVYYRAVIHIPVSEFHATISRYESDSNTSADAYVKEQKDDLLNAWKRFGYETELGTFNGDYCNVIVPSIDLSGLSDESKELLYNDASGSVVSKILGRQTPIHIRGSVYDNT